MSLNKLICVPGECVDQDAVGKALPPQKWATHAYCVSGCHAHEDSEVCTINRIQAEPWRKMLAILVLKKDFAPGEEINVSPNDWDMVQGYMSSPLDEWAAAKGRAKHPKD